MGDHNLEPHASWSHPPLKREPLGEAVCGIVEKCDLAICGRHMLVIARAKATLNKPPESARLLA